MCKKKYVAYAIIFNIPDDNGDCILNNAIIEGI